MKTAAAAALGWLSTMGLVALVSAGCANAKWEALGKGGDAGAYSFGGGGSGEGGSFGGDGDDGLCGPLTDQPLDALTPCCADQGGAAHCVPSVPADFQDLVAACPEGGYCVPDEFILQGAGVEPEHCASVGDADGVWMSLCIPQVGDNAGLLPKDDAHPGMACVPCINPLDGTDTGVCSLGTTCDGGGGDGGEGGSSGGGDPGGATCDNPGAPINPSLFDPCPNSCGGRCVQVGLLPDPNDPSVAQLEECSPGSGTLCVPEELIASKGLFVPDTCSFYGLEGRCMSTCIPDIAEQVASGFLQQSTCSGNHACVPCFDPMTDEPTGACTLECDAGPDPSKPHDFPGCCNGIGTCVPGALAGDQSDQLGQDSCPDGTGLVCAPNDLMPGSGFVPQDCTPEFNFVSVDPDHQYGVCLPGCLPGLDSFFLNNTGECGPDYLCAPCWQPGFFGDDESNAPGCVY